MRIVNELLLAEFRSRQRCELCGRATPEGCEPHHLASRGHGGGYRIDARPNLMSLCPGPWGCHQKYHDGKVRRIDLLAVVANREGVSVEDIKEAIWKLQRTPNK